MRSSGFGKNLPTSKSDCPRSRPFQNKNGSGIEPEPFNQIQSEPHINNQSRKTAQSERVLTQPIRIAHSSLIARHTFAVYGFESDR